jgi:hypothetical protein
MLMAQAMQSGQVSEINRPLRSRHRDRREKNNLFPFSLRERQRKNKTSPQGEHALCVLSVSVVNMNIKSTPF